MQQISNVVTKIHAILSGPDTRFTYFQAPVRVEDVVGRVFPFPSECSVAALNAEITVRFNKGPGRRQVQAGDFEIFDARDSRNPFTIADDSKLLPGISVLMAVIVVEEVLEDLGKCPSPRCASLSFIQVPGGGKTW